MTRPSTCYFMTFQHLPGKKNYKFISAHSWNCFVLSNCFHRKKPSLNIEVLHSCFLSLKKKVICTWKCCQGTMYHRVTILTVPLGLLCSFKCCNNSMWHLVQEVPFTLFHIAWINLISFFKEICHVIHNWHCSLCEEIPAFFQLFSTESKSFKQQ